MNKNGLLCFYLTLALGVSTVLNGCSHSSSATSASIDQNKAAASSNKKADQLAKKYNPEKAAKLNVDLGLAYLDSNQPARGKIKLQKALELAPYLPDVHAAFGRYYESIGESAEAEKAYLKAVKLGKNWAVSHNLYGAFLCKQGKYEQANRSFQKALEDKTYPESALVLENAGLCELAAGNKNKAKGYFEKAIRQDVNRANSSLELAYMYYEQHQYTIAWQLYHRYLLAANQTPHSLYLGVQLARVLNHKDKEASYMLLLKNEYRDSLEYKQLGQSS